MGWRDLQIAAKAWKVEQECKHKGHSELQYTAKKLKEDALKQYKEREKK